MTYKQFYSIHIYRPFDWNIHHSSRPRLAHTSFEPHSIGTYIIRAALDCEHTSFKTRSIGTYIIRAELDRNVHHSSRAKRKICFPGLYGQRKPRSDCADAQSDQGPRCSLPESLDTIKCINGEQRLGLDLVHAQDDVNQNLLRVLESIVSLDAPKFRQMHRCYMYLQVSVQ